MNVSAVNLSKKIILALILGLLIPLICEAQVTARFDRQVIAIDETVRLTIEADGARNTIADIDTAALESNFSILSRSNNSSFQIINGSASVKKTWVFEIEPKHTGSFKIPPFVIGKEKSNPLTLKVTDSTPVTPANTRNLKNVFLEVTPQMDSPAYLQGQITVSVKLFINSQMRISEASLEEPDIPHAVVQKLGDDRNYQIKRGAQTYQVIERKYAIIAEEGDAVIIKPLRFQGISLSDGNRRLLGDPFFGRLTNQGTRIWAKSQELKIALTPIPAEFHGKNWLPARNLNIVEKKDGVKELKVGEPLTRIIQIEALGLTAEQLPEISVKAPEGSKVYLDQPEMQTKIDSGDLLHAVKRQSLAFIPSRPGTFTLPAINIKWWDVINNRPQQAVLPERTITVIAAAAPQTGAGKPEDSQKKSKTLLNSDKNEGDKTQLGSLDSQITIPQPENRSQQNVAGKVKLWQMTSAALMLLWIITIILWFRSGRKHRRIENHTTVATPTVRPIANRNAIKKACLANNPKEVQTAILEWAAATWPQNTPANLRSVARKLEQTELEKIFSDLEKALYSPEEKSGWNGEKTWQEIGNRLKVERQTANRHKTTGDDRLPPLYKQS